MASYSLEEFVGTGALKEIVGSLVSDGWDDVPTLKVMSPEDMEALKLTQQQRDALEIRTHLHDRSLMVYADKLEASQKNLAELLNESPANLATQYGMRRGHVARFIDRTTACGVRMPPSLSIPASRRARSVASSKDSTVGEYSPPKSPSRNPNPSPGEGKENVEPRRETKGIVAAGPEAHRLCGLIPPLRVSQDVTPVESLEKISVQRVTPEHRKGVEPWGNGNVSLPPPSKAGELWSRRPTLLFIVRRPGCVMCRAEAHQLYARKPIFDALGVQLVAVIGEYFDAEVQAFWPRYWGGMVVLDNNREFFRALGGGELLKDNLLTGFCFNPVARGNYKRAKDSGAEGNTAGEGLIKGGMYIIRAGKGGVAYQFVERNFGDWAPVDELISVCSSLQTKTVDNDRNEA